MRIKRSICPLTMLVERSMLTMRIERSISPLTMLVERSMVHRRHSFFWSDRLARSITECICLYQDDSLDFILQRRGREGDYARALSRLCRCGDLLAFLFSRVCTRALSRATHAPPGRNTPSSSTVLPHTAAACSETATDPVDHTSKHPDPLRERRPSKRRRSAPP